MFEDILTCISQVRALHDSELVTESEPLLAETWDNLCEVALNFAKTPRQFGRLLRVQRIKNGEFQLRVWSRAEAVIYRHRQRMPLPA